MREQIMGTHTDTEHRLGSTIERNLSHQVDEMGRFDRPFTKVMHAAAGHERRAKRVRKMAAGGAVAALLVTGFGVSRIDRDKRPGIAAQRSVEPLRLVPGWMPGGLDALTLRTTEAEVVGQGSLGSLLVGGAVFDARSTRAGATIPSALFAESFAHVERFPAVDEKSSFNSARGVEHCIRWLDRLWAVSLCTPDTGAVRDSLIEVGRSLSVSQPDGQLSSSLVSRDGRRQLLQSADLATVQSWTLSQSGSLIQVEGIQTTNNYLEVEFAGLRPGEVATTIRGLSGFETTFYPQRIRWKEKGWFLTVRGAQAKEGELRKVAESLKEASEAEWERLKLPPFGPDRLTDLDEFASTDITSGQAGGGDWTLSAGLRSTADGCLNVKIVARDGNVEACMAVSSSDLVMSSQAVTVNGQRMALVAVTEGVDALRVVGDSATPAVDVDGGVVSVAAAWKWVGVALIPLPPVGAVGGAVELEALRIEYPETSDGSGPEPAVSGDAVEEEALTMIPVAKFSVN
jgi:hypothetical protein